MDNSEKRENRRAYASGQDGLLTLQELRWVEESRQGNLNAFNHLVLQWERSIYNLILRMIRRPEEAAEITQDVFLAAYRSIGSFQGRSRFSTWLYRIAVNHCLTHLARRSPSGTASLEDKFSARCQEEHLSEKSHEEQVIRRTDGRRAVQAMQGLPMEWKMVLELKFLQDLTFEEIGDALSIPVSTVKSRLYAGLQALQERLR